MPFGGMAEYDEATSTYKLVGNVILKDTIEFTSGEWTFDLNGNAMIQSDSSTPLGNGGTGGSVINTSKPDYVINSGTAAEAPETEGEIYQTNGKLKTPNITQ